MAISNYLLERSLGAKILKAPRSEAFNILKFCNLCQTRAGIIVTQGLGISQTFIFLSWLLLINLRLSAEMAREVTKSV